MTKLVVFDLDGVLVDIESSWCWVHDHFNVNNDDSLRLFMIGLIDDEEFMRRDIELWQNKRKLNISEIREILSTVPLMNGAQEALAKLREAGLICAIISGGIDILAKRVAEEVGIDRVMANPLETDSEGNLTGRGIPNVLLKEKDKVIIELQKSLGIGKGDCISIGNSQIDVPMFRNSRIGIAFNPHDEIVRRNADIIIEKKDLREVLPHILG
jgi:phosphoserine phosphatase